MQITKTHKIIISIIALIILLGVYIAFDRNSRNKQNEPVNTSTNESLSTTTASSNTNVTNIEGTGRYTIEPVSGNEGAGVPQPVPDLNRKIIVYSGAVVTQEASILATEKILSLQSELKKNTADLKSWINLGIYQKMAGDYSGAVLSWKYAGRLSPTNYVSPGNLGNLYAYFIKDNNQAEIYYKEAISKGPTQAYLYIQLAEFYRDIVGDSVKAASIISQGLSKIPNNPALLQFQLTL